MLAPPPDGFAVYATSKTREFAGITWGNREPPHGNRGRRRTRRGTATRPSVPSPGPGAAARDERHGDPVVRAVARTRRGRPRLAHGGLQLLPGDLRHVGGYLLGLSRILTAVAGRLRARARHEVRRH